MAEWNDGILKLVFAHKNLIFSPVFASWLTDWNQIRKALSNASFITFQTSDTLSKWMNLNWLACFTLKCPFFSSRHSEYTIANTYLKPTNNLKFPSRILFYIFRQKITSNSPFLQSFSDFRQFNEKNLFGRMKDDSWLHSESIISRAIHIDCYCSAMHSLSNKTSGLKWWMILFQILTKK